jgi:thiamine kinase-like enzyme
MQALESIFDNFDIIKAPCHNDTTPSNFIFSNGELKIIDWEYSGNNDPLWDLVNLSMEAQFNEEQDDILLKAYYEKPSQDILMRFALYKPLVEYWVSLWALVQMSNKNCVDSLATLQEMERDRFASCLRQIESNSFKEALAASKTEFLEKRNVHAPK